MRKAGMRSADIDEALAATPVEIGERLVSLPEGQWFERKSVRIKPAKLAEALVGFANAEGGTIVIGIHDGTIEGLDGAGPKHQNDLRQTSVDFCAPPVRCTVRLVSCLTGSGQTEELFVIEVPASEVLHETVDHRCFLRIGDETRKLDSAATQELRYDKGSQAFEATRVVGLTENDLDTDLLKNYAERLGHNDPIRLLEDRTGTRGPSVTVAACLLFARQPTVYLPTALIRVTRYQGRERLAGVDQRIVADERFEGPIPLAILEARKRIAELQPRRRALHTAGTFEDVATVPEDAWLEGLVNAVVHRSYSLQGDHIHVDIFDDRIEITNPGTFPHVTDLVDPLKIRRFARNPRIVRACSDLKICQELGEGIRRIVGLMRDFGLSDPLYEQTSSSVTLTLSAEPYNRVLDGQHRQEVQRILAALRRNDPLSTAELVEAVGHRSRPFVRQLLNTMEQAGLVEWNGKSTRDPRASWHLPRGRQTST
jgi:ATP-dependent DNA helicase RecG